MAELRRVGGRLESHRRIRGPRALLPAEVELCETLGINEQEYWTFVDAAAEYVHERNEECELSPTFKTKQQLLRSSRWYWHCTASSAYYRKSPVLRAKNDRNYRRELQRPHAFTPTNNFSDPRASQARETVPLIYPTVAPVPTVHWFIQPCLHQVNSYAL